MECHTISMKGEYIKYLFHSKLSEGLLLCVIITDIYGRGRDICEISEGIILGEGLLYEMITEINK